MLLELTVSAMSAEFAATGSGVDVQQYWGEPCYATCQAPATPRIREPSDRPVLDVPWGMQAMKSRLNRPEANHESVTGFEYRALDTAVSARFETTRMQLRMLRIEQ